MRTAARLPGRSVPEQTELDFSGVEQLAKLVAGGSISRAS